MPKWISVEEELPAPNRLVLTYRESKGYCLAYWVAVPRESFPYLKEGWANGRYNFDDVTHWMMLPEAP